MSHTTQRRGLDPAQPGKEIIVLAMIPARYKNIEGIGSAMSELGLKMLEHQPENWIIKNYTEITIPKFGPAQKPLEWMHQSSPDATDRLVMRLVGQLSTVITALYLDRQKVIDLIQDLKAEWLANNRKKGYPISICLSGLFDDIHQCCQKTNCTEHTFLHSLGFFGPIQKLPSEDELKLITMCGHGLIAVNRVRHLVKRIERKEISARTAAEEIAKPCVCGIVNQDRSEEIFRLLAEK